MSAIAIIPARGGSTRLPGKNKRDFEGAPIIGRSIITALASGLFDQVFVSTDDPEIAEIAMHYDAVAMYRPKADCENAVGTQWVIGNCVATLNIQSPTLVCGIYPCAPLMIEDDLQRAHRILIEQGYFRFAMSVGGEPLRDAGAFYFGRAEAFTAKEALITSRTAMVFIPEVRVCDINTQKDWDMAVQKYRAIKTEK